MSHLFERPLCELGRAYDFAYRPSIGDPAPALGGPCDDRPHRVELFAADADAGSPAATWLAFQLCPDHEGQLRAEDRRFAAGGRPSRFRPPRPT